MPAHFPLLPAAWICIIRYHQLRDWGVRKWFNRLILWTGLLCTLATSVVGNFQVRRRRLVSAARHANEPETTAPSTPRGLWLLIVGARLRTAFWDLCFSFGPWAGEGGELLCGLRSERRPPWEALV